MLAASAGYVRNALVLASFGEHSEFEYLEKILLDVVCTGSVPAEDAETNNAEKPSKYEKYRTEHYTQKPHEYAVENPKKLNRG